MKRNDKGFTLIELLVVIAIIALLSTLSVLALNTARVKARDSRRLADINQIRTALEMYYNDQYGYPSGSMSSTTGLTQATGGFAATSSASGTVYMVLAPTAPTPSDGNCSTAANTYTYTQQSSGSSYSLAYCLSSGVATATPLGMK